MKRIVKKTGFVRKNDIYTSEADEAFLIEVTYEMEEDVPSFGIQQALRHIADGKRVMQLNPTGTKTEAGPFAAYALPSNYNSYTKFILFEQ